MVSLTSNRLRGLQAWLVKNECGCISAIGHCYLKTKGSFRKGTQNE